MAVSGIGDVPTRHVPGMYPLGGAGSFKETYRGGLLYGCQSDPPKPLMDGKVVEALSLSLSSYLSSSPSAYPSVYLSPCLFAYISI